MKCFVISLKYSNDKRRTHMKNEFSSHNIPFEFFDAITPNENAQYANLFKINLDNTELTQGEISCLFSHLTLWKQMIDNNLDRIAIFEDDIYLSSSAKDMLDSIESISTTDFDVIKLEKSLERVLASKFYKIRMRNSSLHILKDSHLGSAGYVITNSAARKTITYIQNENIIAPIDIIVFDKLIKSNYKIMQIFPAFCIQDFIKNKCDNNFPSSLENERSLNYEKIVHIKSKNIFSRILKEILRPFKRIYNRVVRLNRKKLIIE
ncbi:lipooligosaccharide biosynthesis protein lpsA [Glaesserella parasuis 29755]|uniref:glycosyltransferase family 25 protein n=1 Tax=Glaesserella parasuis TaxID=738 RepID=UPI000165B2B8|nr:glycosyltransferase family 25 protein [Glaesserella parasuis]AWY45159.1 glycosyl transferase family 25 [Glaesserella parasuis 29755]EQA95728.1 glycosyltransferase 25 family protein [Glaesserella parasuis 29755]MDO9757696.1 glycosyltransferase family 25 protein [Glaesserella parasuis]MDO9853141.1 glycosyltransferase family 25 protein [Glaesserella parasuis]MDP0047325.1 glycosyltransferase family 25 protein [Glaesserella parasuis]